MSTELSPMSEPRPPTDDSLTDDPPTEIAARGREDPWAADHESAPDGQSPAGRSQLLFDPRSVARLRNLVDEENAYCS